MIRKMCELDIPQIALMGLAYSKETDTHDSFDYDLDTVMLQLSLAVVDPNAQILVAIKDNTVIGFIWGVITHLPWSTEVIALDNILYIVPCCRGEIHGIRLIRAYESWAESKNATQVSISIASGITEDRTCNIYKRLGYSYIGSQYRKDI